jgi:hypothetical protein
LFAIARDHTLAGRKGNTEQRRIARWFRFVVSQFPSDFLEALAKRKEVRLTTYGRKTGMESSVTIWIVTDGKQEGVHPLRAGDEAPLAEKPARATGRHPSGRWQDGAVQEPS